MGSSKPSPYDNNARPGTIPHASSSSAHSLQPYVDVDAEADADIAPPPAYTEEDTTPHIPKQPGAPAPPPQSHPPLPDPANYALPDSLTITNNRAECFITSSSTSPTDTNTPPIPASAPTTTAQALRPQTTHTTLSLSPTLSTDASALYSLLLTQSRLPPNLSICVVGTHEEKSRKTQRNRKAKTVTDFRFKIETGGTLLRGWDLDDNEAGRWRSLHVVKDEDGEKAYRGGRVKRGGDQGGTITIGDGGRFQDSREPDAEQALMSADDPDSDSSESTHLTTLRTWCTRFCHSDPSSLRSFTLTRPIHNLDFPVVKAEITSLIRSLNYRGRITITTSSTHHALTIQTPHILNRLRANQFIWWTCVILQLWIITWPLFFLLESKYAVVQSRWYVSRRDERRGVYDSSTMTYEREYARGRSEKEWVAYWGAAIKEAALTRRRDWEVVSEGDVRRLATEGGDGVEVLRRAEMEADWERRARAVRGEGTWRDAVMGFWRGWTGRGSEWDQVRGWGGDI